MNTEDKDISFDDISDEDIKAIRRAYYRRKQHERLADPEKRRAHNAYQREWRRKNRERKRIYNQTYWAKRAARETMITISSHVDEESVDKVPMQDCMSREPD